MPAFRSYLLLFVFALAGATALHAQDAAARYEIDAKRIGVDPRDKDALPRSREFIRLDSTYYVGWMYEGIYKADRSADYLGYRNAIIPLQKSFDLLDKDFGKTFRSLYNSFDNLYRDFNRLQDLFLIFAALKECYDNLEMPRESMALIDWIDSYRFKNDYGFDLCYHRSWMYHRNRFLTSKNAAFLGNSVEDNERLAFQWCYNGLAYIQKYSGDNEAIFGPGQDEQRQLTIYHNLALLHCYNKNYDSSVYYYEKLADGGRVSWNNYGGMQGEIGNFSTSAEYFSMDLYKGYSNYLREPYYYLPELYVFAGRQKEAIRITQEMISESGSTPGFGWYNIALARGYLYDAQLDSAELALDKAANFKELHIGTTLTQSQYDFTINLLRVQLYDKKIQQEKFLNKGWWYSPQSLYNIALYTLEKKMAEYITVNQLMYNPERNRLLYDLFCAEATTSFDEAWFLMRDFSPQYFIKKYEGYRETDKRGNIQRYFNLFIAKFTAEKGDQQNAIDLLEEMERTVVADTAYEKLFIARAYESLAGLYDDADNTSGAATYGNALLELYPQLLPYSGLKPQVQLNIQGADDATVQQVIDELKDCNIAFSTDANNPSATIAFTKKGSAYEVLINMRSATGKRVVLNERLIFKQPEGAGKEIALRLFGKGGGLVYEPVTRES